MFEDLTVEKIKKDILDRAGLELETREGGFLDTLVGPVAVELWKLYQAMNAVVPIAYVDESSGGYIDLRCAEFGLERKAGTRARAVMTLTGKAGTAVPKGTGFLTGTGLEFDLEEAVVLTGGEDVGTALAAQVGTAYNVGAGELGQMVVTIPGLESWHNAAAGGGTDPESDEALVGRLYERLREPATSGNVGHYEQWAKEVDGIGGVKVTPLWAGPGTVKVLVVGPEQEPVSEEKAAECAGHIEALRPIGATVTVQSAEGLVVDVAAAVNTDGSVTAAQVAERFRARLDGYLKSIAFRQYTLLYNRVAFLLLDIEGVVDYTALTVNGGTGNVVIGAEQVPVLGEVVLT